MMGRSKKLKPDSKGYYYRNLGYLCDKDGNPTRRQHKFLLGRDESQALACIDRLEQFWESVKRYHLALHQAGEEPHAQPTWGGKILDIAKAISRGDHVYRLPRLREPMIREDCGEAATKDDQDWADADYAAHLTEMQRDYPAITFLPEEEAAFQNGIRKTLEVSKDHQKMADGFAQDVGSPRPCDVRETLHASIRAFHKSIDGIPRYQNPNQGPGEQPLKAWGYKLKEMCEDFLTRYEDRPLSALSSLKSVQLLYDYWRNRPTHRRTGKPLTVKTLENRMTALGLLLKWIHKSDEFSWRKPPDFDEIERSINETREEIAAKARPDQVRAFLERNIVTLYQDCTTPMERLLMLLGLNCGFKQAEAGTLTEPEMDLESQHPFSELLAYHTSDADSFIKRIRQKTSVYGEYKLWPHTVLGLKWLIERRRKQTVITKGASKGEDITMGPSTVLLTAGSGYPMYRLYKSGNTSQDIPKLWGRVVERARLTDPTLPKHTYSALRCTTANFLRMKCDGEVASLFLSHGHPFEKDKLLEDYTNRPFGKLFRGLDSFAERLQSMFDAVPDPFPSEEKKGGANIPPSRIREIKQLLAEGKSKAEVARIVGVHRATVYRYAE